MAWTPARWEELQRADPEVHEELTREAARLLAGRNSESSAHDIPLRGRAAELGFFVYGTNGVEFAEPELCQLYLVQAALELAINGWETDDGFADAVNQLEHCSVRLGIGADLGAQLLLALTDRGKDVLQRVRELAIQASVSDTRTAFWSIYDPFCKALPDLNPPADLLVGVLGAVAEAVARDFTNGLIHSAVQRLASRSRESADSLIAAFLGHEDPRVVAFAGDALLALGQMDLTEAHRRAMMLADDTVPVRLRTGIVVLGALPYPEQDGEPLSQATIERLAELRARPLPDADHMLPQAYGNLLRLPEAQDGLLELASRSDTAVQYMVALVLMRNADEVAGHPWFGEALRRLAASVPVQEQTLRLLDLALAKRAVFDAVGAIAVLESWAAAGGLGGMDADDAKLPETFSSTFRHLRGQARPELEAAVTRWWASGNRSLHRCAWQLVGGHDFASEQDGHAPLELSPAALGELTEEAVRLVLYRVMAYVIGGKPLSMLLVSALRREPCPPWLAAFVTDALDQVVLYNYPGGASEYLQSRLQIAGVSELEATVIREAISRSEKYFSARAALPVIPELRPPSSRVSLYQRAQGKHHAEIMESAQNQSVFLNLVRRVTIKYGRGFSVQRPGVAPDPTPLKSFSYEAEMPRAELIDPIGQTARRIQWQNMGIDAEPDERASEMEGETEA